MLTLESFEQASEIVKQVTQETKVHIRFVVPIIRSALFPMKREIKV